jgi:hypothetical protein
MSKKRKDITFKVWLEIERYDERIGEGQTMDAPGSSLAQFATYEEAWDYAQRVTSLDAAQAAIADAEAAGITPASAEINVHAYLAERRQIASIWHIEDVQSVRPDLTDGQAWKVLQSARRNHDANTGINWDVLECHADMLFGPAPETPAAEEA